MICTPKSLAVAATPLTRLSQRQKQAVKTSLLCSINTVGLLPGRKITADWVTRVQPNGGAVPSQQTQNAAITFINSLKACNVLSNIVALNIFAPDSLIAALTPLIKGPGVDPWVNHGFVAGDLTASGLTGDGATKWLDTGVVAKTAMPNAKGGLALYCPTSYAVATVADDMGGYETGATIAIELSFSGTANNLMFSYGNYSSMWVGGGNAGPFLGLLLGYAFGTTTRSYGFFKANGTIGWTQISSTTVGSLTNWPNVNIYLFARNQAGAAGGFSARQFSFAAIFTFADAASGQCLYNAVQTLRWGLGGGYVGPLGVFTDTFESYTPGTNVNGLGAYVVKENFTGYVATDTFETYTPGANVAGLTGGTGYGGYGWNGAYALTGVTPPGGLNTGLLAYWNMDGTLGTDSTANGNNVPISGAPTSSAGLIGNAMNTNVTGNGALVATSSAFNTYFANIQPGQSFTASMWLKFLVAPGLGYMGIFSLWNSTTVSYFLWYPNTGFLTFGVNQADGSAGPSFAVTPQPVANTWYHYVFGYDDASKTWWYQINNSARSTSPCNGIFKQVSGTMYFGVGMYAGQNSSPYMLMDEVGFWNRTLSTTEVTQLYNGGLGTPYPF